MRDQCIYKLIGVQLIKKGWDSSQLAKATGIRYSSLRRKLRGEAKFTIPEAVEIKSALECDMPIETLFNSEAAL